jgi:hypothetical protein
MIPYLSKYLPVRPGNDDGNEWKDLPRETTKRTYSNQLPVGQNIEAPSPKNMSASHAPIPGITDAAGRRGYKRQHMSPTEEMYTDESKTGFHDTSEGFVERWNYLDRL